MAIGVGMIVDLAAHDAAAGPVFGAASGVGIAAESVRGEVEIAD